MENLDFYWINRYLEIFAFIILAFVALQKKRPVFFAIVFFLNTFPDLWMIPPENRVEWIASSHSSETSDRQWKTILQEQPPQSILTTILYPLLKSNTKTNTSDEASSAAQEFNSIAFYIRVTLLIAILLLFFIDHVHGVAGLAAFLFPTFYLFHRLFQGIDFFLPFQFNRQLALFRQNPESYASSLGSNPSGIWMCITALTIFCSGVFVLYYFTKRHARTYNIHIPNPENYQVLLNGSRYDYTFTSKGLIIESLDFPLSQAFSNQATPHELHFASGTVIHFVKREIQPPSRYGSSIA